MNSEKTFAEKYFKNCCFFCKNTGVYRDCPYFDPELKKVLIHTNYFCDKCLAESYGKLIIEEQVIYNPPELSDVVLTGWMENGKWETVEDEDQIP